MFVERCQIREHAARHVTPTMPVSPRLLLLATLVVFCLQPGTAYAYIDPNAGGMLFQLLAPMFAAAVGAWLFLRRWIAQAMRNLWHRLPGRRPE